VFWTVCLQEQLAYMLELFDCCLDISACNSLLACREERISHPDFEFAAPCRFGDLSPEPALNKSRRLF
jgi:hypothetical protein